VRLLPDASGGGRLRRGGRQTRLAAWKGSETWYCRACHVELHELRGGDWEVDFIGADGDVERSVYLAPAGSGVTRCAVAFLRGALRGGREARWHELLLEGEAEGFAAHTLLRARLALTKDGALCHSWRGRGHVVWSLGYHGNDSWQNVPVCQWDRRFSHAREVAERV
jgi:hypothetical protein